MRSSLRKSCFQQRPGAPGWSRRRSLRTYRPGGRSGRGREMKERSGPGAGPNLFVPLDPAPPQLEASMMMIDEIPSSVRIRKPFDPVPAPFGGRPFPEHQATTGAWPVSKIGAPHRGAGQNFMAQLRSAARERRAGSPGTPRGLPGGRVRVRRGPYCTPLGGGGEERRGPSLHESWQLRTRPGHEHQSLTERKVSGHRVCADLWPGASRRDGRRWDPWNTC